MLSPQDIFQGEGFPEAGIVFGGVLFPKLRSSSISRSFLHVHPHPSERSGFGAPGLLAVLLHR